MDRSVPAPGMDEEKVDGKKFHWRWHSDDLRMKLRRPCHAAPNFTGSEGAEFLSLNSSPCCMSSLLSETRRVEVGPPRTGDFLRGCG
jgi:hypothetical protein